MSTDSEPSGFKSDAQEETANATESENPPGEAVAGAPGHKDDDCNATYHTERHNFSDRAELHEESPSAGWRAVYYAMGVRRP
jgi:hypothetical protein